MSDSEHTDPRHVVIVGGGLAGIAAATALARFPLRVTLLESRNRLGGRATSHVDAESGEILDNCQHVSMGCCTNLTSLAESLGIGDLFQIEETLNFIAPDGKLSEFSASNLPAPLHLSGAFLRLPWLSFSEKCRFAWACRSLARSNLESLRGRSFLDWLKQHRQSDNLIRNVWEIVLVSALSESLDRIDAAYARKVFVDGFLANRDGWKVSIPTVSLDALYSERTMETLRSRGVEIRTQSRVTGFDLGDQCIAAVLTHDGQRLEADEFLLAVPQHQVGRLLPDDERLRAVRESADRIESAPITSVHLWYDRPLTDLPHAVLIERMGQWVFHRGRVEHDSRPASLYQVVISASRNLGSLSTGEILETVHQELLEVFPLASDAKRLHGRVITERRAVFSCVPGIDEHRLPQQSPIENLQFACDWTRTGWPATMEGAVRSGFLAAENVLRRHGFLRPGEPPLLQPDLPVSSSSRWLLGLR